MSAPKWTLGLAGLAAIALTVRLAASEQGPLGLFEGAVDVGPVALQGSARHDEASGTYVVEGAGSNMWFDRDELHLVWKRLAGDFVLRARARFLDAGGHPHKKMGWIVRTSLEPDSPHANVAVHGDGLTALQFRRRAGGETEEIRASLTAPEVIQLSRRGDTYAIGAAREGGIFERHALEGLELGPEVYVGLYVCSHEVAEAARAVFDEVRIVRPAPAGFVPYRDYIGSRLELLDVESGRREIVHESPRPLQAPNWTPDGEALIYNLDGRLYRFDLASRESSPLDTGFATANNNDHVISFDGTRLGISHHAADEAGRSIIYTVPLAGGAPTRVTERGPSYLHGWSPDDRSLIYTAEREGQYDLYRIAVEGGEEERLTDASGLDDGSEYSPDGRWIYFNSERTGSMEIWRMRPDGSGAHQMTDDPLQNWFPHVSPDGRQVAFLSYEASVAPGDHPFYEEVYLRVMPADGGEPRVVAYLYGGQGSFNVPSWSPDSRRLAFVSNDAGL